MGIEFDAVTTAGLLFGTGRTFAHSTGSGAYRHAQVCIYMHDNAVISGTPTYGGINLALIDMDVNTNANGARAYLYHLVDPLNGSNNLIYALSGNAVNGAAIITRTGIDPNNPLGTSAKADGNTSTPATVDVTSGEGELVVDSCAAAQDDPGTLTVGAGQTTRSLHATTASFGFSFAASEELGDASVTMSHQQTSGNPLAWAIVAVPLKPYISPRDRLIKYWASTLDPKGRIFDNTGRVIPASLVEYDNWLRNEGPYFMTPKKHTSLIEADSIGYLEAIKFVERGQTQFITETETLLESLFRRLGARGA